MTTPSDSRTLPSDDLGPARGEAPNPADLAFLAAAWGIIVASALAAAWAGVHPTGQPLADRIYAGAFGALVAWAGARAGRVTLLWLGAVGLVLSRGVLLVPAFGALLAAFADSVRKQPSRLIGAACAATGVQVVLRWPHWSFQGATALAAAAAVGPVLVHGTAGGTGRWKRLFSIAWGLVVVALFVSIPIGVQVLRSISAINAGTAATDQALAAVRNADTQGATQELARATADFAAARARMGQWWTGGARFVPLVAQQRRALLTGVEVAEDVTRSVGQQAATVDIAGLHYNGGAINLAQIESWQTPLSVVNAHLTAGLSNLRAGMSDWLLPPLSSRMGKLHEQILKAANTDSLASQTVQDAPSLLGADGTRHYLIALTDTSESRGLGGLLVWYGNLTVTNGKMKLESNGDALNVGAQLVGRGGGHLSGPADYIARYGNFHPQDTFIDATYSPDLPSVADVVSQLYSQVGNPPIDGMLVLDPRSLATLFTFTGPISVPGFGLVDAGNAEQLLEKTEYALYPGPGDQTARKAVLSQLMDTASKRLTSGTTRGVREMAKAMGPDVTSGDLLFWSTHAGDQGLLNRVGLAGRFPGSQGGDLLAVTTQNAANNKIDAYLQRTISDQVVYDPARRSVSATVTVTLNNSAPDQGLSYQVIGSYRGSGLLSGTNLSWVSVYSPLGLVSATLDGRPVSMGTIPELGVETYSTYMQVAGGKSMTLVVHLNGRLPTGKRYSLALYQQPMINPDHLDVSVADRGSSIAPRVWIPPRTRVAFRVFSG